MLQSTSNAFSGGGGKAKSLAESVAEDGAIVSSKSRAVETNGQNVASKIKASGKGTYIIVF